MGKFCCIPQNQHNSPNSCSVWAGLRRNSTLTPFVWLHKPKGLQITHLNSDPAHIRLPGWLSAPQPAHTSCVGHSQWTICGLIPCCYHSFKEMPRSWHKSQPLILKPGPETALPTPELRGRQKRARGKAEQITAVVLEVANPQTQGRVALLRTHKGAWCPSLSHQPPLARETGEFTWQEKDHTAVSTASSPPQKDHFHPSLS